MLLRHRPGARRIVIATGIANIYGRDPVTRAAGQKTLAEAYPNRFLLGLGVSHVPLVEQLRGHRYDKPVASMRSYLDAMDQAPYRRSSKHQTTSGLSRTWATDGATCCGTR
jgi:alkanesulfonate monooxygenase SsuD/methylene tetrahydromethanopterin reductase-like flavin-dependent oxidoreductase (luciferase family)